MKNKLLYIIVSLFMFGCTFNNFEDYFEQKPAPPQFCNTEGITYDSLTYMFTGICAKCHNVIETRRSGIEMDTYSSVKISINTGKVLPAITHTGSYKMPYNLPKLSACELNKIQSWIANGMPE